jgi:hypothetical protein
LRYILSVMLILSVFSLRPAQAEICSVTLTNCLSEHIEWCTYDGSSYWDTLFAASIGGTSSSESSEADCNGDSGCYFIVKETESVVWLCTSSDVTGSSDGCNYACVDDSDGITFHTGTDEYCCKDNACSTDCS